MDGFLWDVGFGVGWPLKWRYGVGGGGGMNGFLWDVGFGFGWPKGGHMGHRDGWGPMGSEIWGWVAQKWIYGTGMGEYGAQG